jgi:hypothetical protein
MQEYQRKCNACGKLWHSLISREKDIQRSQKSSSFIACGSAMQSCSSCGQIGSATQAQASRNIDASKSELQRLRSCPECGSANYQEWIIDHAQQLR